MIYSIEDIRRLVAIVAESYDVHEIRLFGSYFDNVPTPQSDIDLVVTYGERCKGLERIRFILDLEKTLNKSVDVLNSDFLPEFFNDLDLNEKGRLIYAR